MMVDQGKSRGVLLQIAELGHPIVRKKCQDVLDIKDKSIQHLIDNMLATVEEADGVGISANQVYQPLRLFIIASHPSRRYPKAPQMTPLAMINPILLKHSKDQVKDWEGCLSIPGIRGNIPRFKKVKVEYTSRVGKKVTKTFKGFISRIFQHEFDHISGVTFLERLKSTKDIISEKEFQKIVRLQERNRKGRKNEH